jgi:hypothetical protein
MLEPLNVKAGDPVILHQPHGLGGITLEYVEKVTPKGYILLSRGRRFRADGFQAGDGGGMGRWRLTVPTEETFAAAERNSLVAWLRPRLARIGEMETYHLELLRAIVGGWEDSLKETGDAGAGPGEAVRDG